MSGHQLSINEMIETDPDESLHNSILDDEEKNDSFEKFTSGKI